MNRKDDVNELLLPRLILNDPEYGMVLAIKCYGNPVRTICRNILADCYSADIEDAVSDCFVNIWQAAGRFDPNQGASFRSYCYGVARLTALGSRRKITKSSVLPLDEVQIAGDDLEDEVGRREDEQLIHEAVESMGEPDRSIFLLRYFYYFKVKEIAAQLDVSAKKVENILSRRKKDLEELLAEGGLGHAQNG